MTIDFLAHVRSESARFGELLAGADPAAPVPTCPDWTAADLLWHLAEVQLFWGAIVRERLDSPDAAEASKPDRPDDYRALLELYGRASAELVAALEDTADDVRVWTWFPADQSAGFVRRRQAHEALIHRFDAELTAGTAAGEVDGALATDGALEVLEWMFGGYPDWATPTSRTVRSGGWRRPTPARSSSCSSVAGAGTARTAARTTPTRRRSQ